MARIAHKTFVTPPFNVEFFKPWPDVDEEFRQQAEDFANQIGADRIVSITERTTNENRFAIVIWYRDE